MKKLSLIAVFILSSVVLFGQENETDSSVDLIYPIKLVEIKNGLKITPMEDDNLEERITDPLIYADRILVRRKTPMDIKPDSVIVMNLKGECRGYKVSQYYKNDDMNTITIQIIGDKLNGYIKFIGQDSVKVSLPQDDHLITWEAGL
jgi:hypothetical protein